MSVRVILIASALAFAAGAGEPGKVVAHHAISNVYDASNRVTLEGVVTDFRLINPHPFLFIAVKNDGAEEEWRLEMDNRFELIEVGVTAGTFKPGERVVVTGSLARKEKNSLYLLRLDRPADGFWYEQVGSSPKISRSLQ
jgi:hypothetical protein